MTYTLTKELETGNPVIDGEHRQLFDAVNRFLEACGTGKGRAGIEPTVKFLLDYVDKHFAHEEELQKKSGYPNLAAHRAFHERYRRDLRLIVSGIPAGGPGIADVGAVNRQIGVLLAHIKTEDRRLGAYLKT